LALDLRPHATLAPLRDFLRRLPDVADQVTALEIAERVTSNLRAAIKNVLPEVATLAAQLARCPSGHVFILIADLHRGSGDGADALGARLHGSAPAAHQSVRVRGRRSIWRDHGGPIEGDQHDPNCCTTCYLPGQVSRRGGPDRPSRFFFYGEEPGWTLGGFALAWNAVRTLVRSDVRRTRAARVALVLRRGSGGVRFRALQLSGAVGVESCSEPQSRRRRCCRCAGPAMQPLRRTAAAPWPARSGDAIAWYQANAGVRRGGVGPNAKSLRGMTEKAFCIELVAGTGFEPVTFRL
jgi:hypothetical protein